MVSEKLIGSFLIPFCFLNFISFQSESAGEKKQRLSEFLTKFHCLHQWMEMELCCHGDGLASVTWFNFVKKNIHALFLFKCFFKPVCQNKTKLRRVTFAFILTDRSFADQQGSTRTNASFLSGCDRQTVGPPVATVTLLCLFPSF